jgi:hypothetical protein
MTGRMRLGRLGAALVLATALALLLSLDARAGRECDGLDVCVSVRGPWVVVPAARVGQRQPTYYQLACPRRYIVAGLDAVVSNRGVHVEFLGSLGSPVNPGITTSTSVVFAATPTGSGAATFQPLIGCIPTSGGGRGTTSVGSRMPQAVPAGRPAIRRVRTVRLRPGTARVLRQGCRSGEHLVSSSAAVAFGSRAEPGRGLITAVSMSTRNAGPAVVVHVKVPATVPASARPEVQIHALCARGPA